MKLENMKAQMRKGVLELCILSIISEAEAYPSDIIGKTERERADRSGGNDVSTVDSA